VACTAATHDESNSGERNAINERTWNGCSQSDIQRSVIIVNAGGRITGKDGEKLYLNGII